jgi:putative protease
MHNNGVDSLKFLEEYGVKRVVLDREMSLSEIKKLPNTIEKEVFCHGALCTSYSGQCLFSSMILNRSGNRGECAGMCRLPYKIENNGKIVSETPLYYLSLKDLCTADYINDILDAGVDSLKIEGRMKSPEYVGYITKIYRKLIDAYYNREMLKLTDEEKQNIKLLFNRGLSKGFINDEEIKDIGNNKSPNHIGIKAGTYKARKDKVKLFLEDELLQGDTIRFMEENKGMTVNFLYDRNGNLINKGSAGQTVLVDNFLELSNAGTIHKVGSIKLNREIQNLPERKVPIKGKITILKDKNIIFEVFDGFNHIEIKGAIPDIAKTKPITQKDILKQLSKTGDTIYSFENIEVCLDENLFVLIRDLNDIRRSALSKLDEARMSTRTRKVEKIKPLEIPSKARKLELNVVINTYEQYLVAKQYAQNIFTGNKNLFDRIKQDEKVHFKFSERMPKTSETEYILGDFGSLMNIKKGDIVHTDYMLNVTNSYSLDALIKRGAHTVCASPEMNTPEICDMQKRYPNEFLEVLIYGKLELMKMKYDPIQIEGENYLIDRNNKHFLIKKDGKLNYLINYKPIDLRDNLDEFLNLNISNYRVDFIDEPKEICENILSSIHKKLF